MFFRSEQDREDFKQEYAIWKWLGIYKKKYFAYTHWLRENYGDFRFKAGKLKNNERCGLPLEFIENKNFTKDNKLYNDVIEGLEERERALIILHFEFNMTYAELARVFDLTQARIKQIFGKIKREGNK
jgi:RNA polymerase sigma factor (sigma-70 family)